MSPEVCEGNVGLIQTFPCTIEELECCIHRWDIAFVVKTRIHYLRKKQMRKFSIVIVFIISRRSGSYMNEYLEYNGSWLFHGFFSSFVYKVLTQLLSHNSTLIFFGVCVHFLKSVASISPVQEPRQKFLANESNKPFFATVPVKRNSLEAMLFVERGMAL